MDEQKTQMQGQGTQTNTQAPIQIPQTPVTDTSGRGAETTIPSSSLGLIDEARKVNEEMRKVNAETRAILQKKEELMAAEMIQGRAYANLIEKKELTAEEYAKRLMTGTLNPLVDK